MTSKRAKLSTIQAASAALEEIWGARPAATARGIAGVLLDCTLELREQVIAQVHERWGQDPRLFLDGREGAVAVFVEAYPDELEGQLQIGEGLVDLELGEGLELLLDARAELAALPGFERRPEHTPARTLARYFGAMAQVFVDHQAALQAYVEEVVWPDLRREWSSELGSLPLEDPTGPRHAAALSPANFQTLAATSPAFASYRGEVVFPVWAPTQRGGFVSVRCTIELSQSAQGTQWSHEITELAGIEDVLDEW